MEAFLVQSDEVTPSEPCRSRLRALKGSVVMALMCVADGSAPFCQRVLPLWALCRLASTDPSEDLLMVVPERSYGRRPSLRPLASGLFLS